MIFTDLNSRNPATRTMIAGVMSMAASLMPIGKEEVGLVRLPGVAVRGPEQLPPVGGEHRESVEYRAEGHLLHLAGARHRGGGVDQEEVEVAAARIPVVR